MVKKRMAMRMVTIFVALIVCGMFFPGLARGEDLSSNQGLNVNFGDVVVGDKKTIPLEITNQSVSLLTLILTYKMDTGCDFTFPEDLVVTTLAPAAILNVGVTFSPSAVGECEAWLKINYTGSTAGLVEIKFTANGVEETSKAPEEEKILIGDIDTGVYDKLDGDGNSIKEMIGICESTAYNHGHLVRCVVRLTRELRREDSITYQ
jgi:hypothetical protein